MIVLTIVGIITADSKSPKAAARLHESLTETVGNVARLKVQRVQNDAPVHPPMRYDMESITS